LLAPYGIALTSSRELGLGEPDETGRTFADNARLKAHAAARASGVPALADDSGLEVLGLGGAPGVHSARWAGPERDFAKAMARVRAALIRRFCGFAAADRRAAFVAVLCLAWPDGHEELAEGRVEVGEMTPADKQKLSHRGRALRRLLAMCFEPH